MRDDEDVIMAGIKVNGLVIRHASMRLRDNPAIGLVAVAVNSKAIKYLSEELRGLREIVATAIENDRNGYNVVKYVAKKFHEDWDLMVRAVTNHPGSVWWLKDGVLENREMAVAYATKSIKAIKNLPPKYQDDKEIIHKYVGTK